MSKQEDNNRFSLHKLLIKLSCRKLWVWSAWTIIAIFRFLIIDNNDLDWIKTFIHWFGGISLGFMISNVLDKIAVILANKTDIKIGVGRK